MFCLLVGKEFFTSLRGDLLARTTLQLPRIPNNGSNIFTFRNTERFLMTHVSRVSKHINKFPIGQKRFESFEYVFEFDWCLVISKLSRLKRFSVVNLLNFESTSINIYHKCKTHCFDVCLDFRELIWFGRQTKDHEKTTFKMFRCIGSKSKIAS